jgi:hypothetical protein
MGQLAAAVERSTASVRRWERDEGMPADAVVQQVLTLLDLEDQTFAVVQRPMPTSSATPEPPVSVSESMRATSVASSSSPASSAPTDSAQPGRFERLFDPGRPWLGYTRAALTVVTLLLLGWLLIWAVGGLADAVGEIWETLSSGTV